MIPGRKAIVWQIPGPVRCVLFRRAPQPPAEMPILVMLFLLLSPGVGVSQEMGADEVELRRLHEELIRAHVEGDADLWMSLEADSVVSVNGGRVTYPARDMRRAQREAYLGDAEFSAYRDLRDPTVRVASDGSLAWLIAEVEVDGTATNAEGVREGFHDVWAWVELYERSDAGWRLIGNASNRR